VKSGGCRGAVDDVLEHAVSAATATSHVDEYRERMRGLSNVMAGPIRDGHLPATNAVGNIDETLMR
jgi:hypothetical protein